MENRVLNSLFGSRKFWLATVGLLAFFGGLFGLPEEVVAAVVTWAGVLIATIFGEDVAQKLHS